MRDIARIAALGLLTGTLIVLTFHAPGAVLREIQFAAGILLLTIVTRSMSAGWGVSALGLGLGPVVFLVVGAGDLMTAAGLEITGAAYWTLVPLVEGALLLLPVAVLMWLHRRRRGFDPNPSDLLMLGCCAGAGFALAENVTFIYNNANVSLEMARQYGPHAGGFYFVPGAWGTMGFVGHAAATGFMTGGYGLGLALRGRLGSRWWVMPAACAAWIILEHTLVNWYAAGAWRAVHWLGSGRLTPWFVGVLAAAIVALDSRRHYATFAQSAHLRRRVRMTRAAMVRMAPPLPRSRIDAARMFLSQLRLVNATAWFLR